MTDPICLRLVLMAQKTTYKCLKNNVVFHCRKKDTHRITVPFIQSIDDDKLLISNDLTHYQTTNFRLAEIETNCRRHSKVHSKWKISTI